MYTGLHLHHRLLHILTPSELKAIHPKRKLRPYIAASPMAVAEQNDVVDADGMVAPCATYLWGALLRLDVLEAPPDALFVFFGTSMMQVYACRLFHEDEVLVLDGLAEDAEDEREGGPREVAFGARSVMARGGLRVAREATIASAKYTTTVADITISGMPGWVSIVCGGMPGQVRLRAWAPKGVHVHVRPPLPCPTPVRQTAFV
jgi:nitric-oxide synthase, plant